MSPYGRRWIAVSLPFGLRYFTYLSSEKRMDRELPAAPNGEVREREPVNHLPDPRIKWKDITPKRWR